jgi:hypothetical protein
MTVAREGCPPLWERPDLAATVFDVDDADPAEAFSAWHADLLRERLDGATGE